MTITPLLSLRIAGTAYFVARNDPIRWSSMCFSQVLSETHPLEHQRISGNGRR